MKFTKQIPTKCALALVVVATAAIAIGIVSGAAIPSGSPSPDDHTEGYTSTVSFLKEPTDLREFASKMDVIVVGRVTSIIGSSTINSYNEQDNSRNIKEEDSIPSALPVTDYELTIEQVILGEDLQANDRITLRAVGLQSNVARYPAHKQMPEMGDRRVYGLSENPDGTYGTYSWWSQFLIDGDQVTHADDFRKPVSFTEDTEPSKFINALREAASE